MNKYELLINEFSSMTTEEKRLALSSFLVQGQGEQITMESGIAPDTYWIDNDDYYGLVNLAV